MKINYGNVYKCQWDKDGNIYYNVLLLKESIDCNENEEFKAKCVYSTDSHCTNYHKENIHFGTYLIKNAIIFEDLGPEKEFENQYPEYYL